MKSITIHGLDSELEKKIEKFAIDKGLSLNKTIKLLLRKALGLGDARHDRYEFFKNFSGIWDEEDYTEFSNALSDFEQIDKADWE